jgi:hypothetical protein
MEKLLIVFLLASAMILAQEKKDFTPKFFGYVRAWHQSDFAKDQSEFIVKQARFGVKGNVNEFAGYRVFVDFARLGKLQTSSTTLDGVTVLTSASASFSDVLLDAEAYINPIKNLSVSVGQFKVPFSTDNLRSGAEIDFVNRPLHTNVTPGIRDVGVMGSYSFAENFPLDLKAGLFNGAGQNKTENDKTTDFSIRGVSQIISFMSLSANYYGGKTAGANLSIFDFGADVKYDAFFATGEFVQRTTSTTADIVSNSYFAYATYTISFTEFFLTNLIPAVRYESFDPNSDNASDEVTRLTAGLSFELAKLNFARFRVNYEMFDYKNGSVNPDKLIFELQTRF